MFIQGEQVPLTRGEGSNLLYGGADFSDEDDELVNVDLLVPRLPALQHASTSLPYRLPPICEDRTGQLAHRSMDCNDLSDVEDGASIEAGWGGSVQRRRRQCTWTLSTNT